MNIAVSVSARRVVAFDSGRSPGFQVQEVTLLVTSEAFPDAKHWARVRVAESAGLLVTVAGPRRCHTGLPCYALMLGTRVISIFS
jgi:hypothetical protein